MVGREKAKGKKEKDKARTEMKERINLFFSLSHLDANFAFLLSLFTLFYSYLF